MCVTVFCTILQWRDSANQEKNEDRGRSGNIWAFTAATQNHKLRIFWNCWERERSGVIGCYCLWYRFFDTSKQAIGAAVIHFANVFLADMFQGDPCTWWVPKSPVKFFVNFCVYLWGEPGDGAHFTRRRKQVPLAQRNLIQLTGVDFQATCTQHGFKAAVTPSQTEPDNLFAFPRLLLKLNWLGLLTPTPTRSVFIPFLSLQESDANGNWGWPAPSLDPLESKLDTASCQKSHSTYFWNVHSVKSCQQTEFYRHLVARTNPSALLPREFERKQDFCCFWLQVFYQFSSGLHHWSLDHLHWSSHLSVRGQIQKTGQPYFWWIR